LVFPTVLVVEPGGVPKTRAANPGGIGGASERFYGDFETATSTNARTAIRTRARRALSSRGPPANVKF